MSQENDSTHKHTNRLAKEKSPYLLQHAHNPVDWYPWGDEAFELARKEDKPVFLSIGYATCHWCHVMERESFEDEEVARLMNEAFVCIKVDREERPDIDGVYMTVCQMLTGSGGWPLTIVMTPDKQPFFAATYLPRESRFGRIGMTELVPRIVELWRTQRDQVLGSAGKIGEALAGMSRAEPGAEPGEELLHQAFGELERRYDRANGGFSRAPKFPTPHNMLFLLRYWKRTGNTAALDMTEATLRAMRRGGVYDHVGFGFHRYSTDAVWLVPHFEKMLYDQALLGMAYVEAYLATGATDHAATAREIYTYVLRDMTAPEGGFYSAEDADSEGHEGKFYVWRAEEFAEVLEKSDELGEEDAALAAEIFNITAAGNFEEESTRERTGDNIPHLKADIAELAASRGLTREELASRIERVRRVIFDHREKRIHPLKDDKVLTDWNGLMIASLAKAARALDDAAYADAARRAADFILTELRREDGRLLHRYRDGEAGLPAHVDDYAFMIWGLLELYEATFEIRYLKEAIALDGFMREDFWDEEGGGYYFTADGAEELPARMKEIYDGAIPSGNSVAMLNLLRLARFTGSAEYEERAASIGRAFSKAVGESPSAFTQFMAAVEFATGAAVEVVIAGDSQAEDTRAMVRAVRSGYHPRSVVILRPSGAEGDEIVREIARIAPFTESLAATDGAATAYVCSNGRCNLPTTDVAEMQKQLEGQSRKRSLESE